MDMLTEALERMFSERATPAVIRGIEAGDDPAALWAEIASSGFLDILLPEDKGGAGVSLDDAFPSFMLAGQHALPLPFVQTVMAKGWLDALGHDAPEGPIAIAGPDTSRSEDGGLSVQNLAFGKAADWVLAGFGDLWVLLPSAAARIEGDEIRGSQTADLYWAAMPDNTRIIDTPEAAVCSPAQLAAASLAPLLAGAARQALDMTLAHVAERQQFGRAIAQFQAVQSLISVMAERVWAMRMAARLALHAPDAMPSPRLAAIGKTRCSEAAPTVADGAHALHGAIGITEEYDLQLYTRRLREWRRAGGTEAWWARQLGREVIQSSEGTALDFILASTK
ncbi:acyl-CoA dehydrogenase family protein [Castellaniella sp.]|uniref:acyl-CoA dehydrogenase family protein n=1 Tax=Castellaniella sp. TaxID=1955812 RepID=UPI0035622220